MPPPEQSRPSSPPGLRIVRATPDDAETLAELVRELARFEKLEASCHMTPALAFQHLISPARSADALLAWLEDAPVGFAVYYRTFSTFVARPGVVLEDLYVRERFRHRGIGRALLATVGRIAHCQEAGRFEWTALKWNENARRLYAAIGAREMDEWTLLRMDAAALHGFVGAAPAEPGPDGCRCGGRGPGHASGPGHACRC
jgi:GNAT superfamily N-acetyltransferase